MTPSSPAEASSTVQLVLSASVFSFVSVAMFTGALLTVESNHILYIFTAL